MGNHWSWPWKSGEVDPDTEWKRQNRAQKENQLYRLINLQKQGELIKIYENEGPEALRKYITETVEPMLYNQGQGKTVTRQDYCRWKKRAQKKKDEVLTDTSEVPVDLPEDEFIKIQDHQACWDLDKRGAMGETALHLLVLHDTPSTTDIAKILLDRYPNMSWDYYEDDEYFGESALHFAIVYGNFEMVRLLVESGADVNLRATGRFFLPEDQKRKQNPLKTNYIGYAYYGEYPLAFAACFGQEEIYDYLLEKGADPNKKDSFGNTVLHMMVISNQLGMFGYAVKHHSKKALLDAQNAQNLTPLTLASKMGRNDIFKEMIELQSVEIWRYSNVTCAIYPIAPLDTIGPGGNTNWSSSLIYITDGDSDDHLEMLEGGVIKQLLDEKWKTFARRRFFLQLALAVGHLIMLSVAIYLRPATDFLSGTDTNSIIRYCTEIVVVLYCGVTMFFQLSEIRTQGVLGFAKNMLQAPAKSIFNLSCLLILLCVPMRFIPFSGHEGAEIILLSIAAPCAWFFMLFFARGLDYLGPFVVLIYLMLSRDLISFSLIGSVVIIGCFLPGFYYLFKDIEDENITTFASIEGTVMQLIQMTFGEFKYEDFDQTRQPELTKFVFGLFAVFVPILLLNMLIAMMGNTYQLVISRSEKEWKRQWAKIIIVLERSHSQKDLVRFQESYSVDMIGGSPGDRGLMVIKTSKKTRARQRKGAISNWKRIVKEIKDMIKEQKREGIKGPLDLNSSSFSDRQQRKRRSVRNRTNAPLAAEDGDPLDFEESQSAEALLSTIKQVSWTHDIDLTKGTAFTKPANIPEEEEGASEKQPLIAQPKLSPAAQGIDNPVHQLDKQTNRMETSKDNKAIPKGRSAKVNPSELPTVAAVQSQAKTRHRDKPLSAAQQKAAQGISSEVFTISGKESSTSLSALMDTETSNSTDV